MKAGTALAPTGRPDIDNLIYRIEESRRIIDVRLARPARWRGGLLRETKLRREFPEERMKYGEMFNRLASIARPSSPIDVKLLLEINRQVAGYGEFRKGSVRVGKRGDSNERCPHPIHVPHMVERALARSVDEVEPPVLAAARLHMELVLIHPFRDGNGRTARLMSAFLLMRAGFRSTLFTSVEEHYHLNPGVYRPAFKQLFNASQLDVWPWLLMALQSMYNTSAIVGWFYEREARLKTAATLLGLSGGKIDRALKTYDLGDPEKSPIAASVRKDEKPWSELQRQFKPEELGALRGQLKRITDEQTAELPWVRRLLTRKF